MVQARSALRQVVSPRRCRRVVGWISSIWASPSDRKAMSTASAGTDSISPFCAKTEALAPEAQCGIHIVDDDGEVIEFDVGHAQSSSIAKISSPQRKKRNAQRTQRLLF